MIFYKKIIESSQDETIFLKGKDALFELIYKKMKSRISNNRSL
jgi:hypothetical protein